MSKGLLIDVTKCIGCFSCVEACRVQNGLPEGGGKKLSAVSYTALEDHEGLYVRRLCMHCKEPACASACPVSALYKTELGPVAYNPSICLGCRYCMVACPFGVPKYEWDKAIPRVRKCVMCIDRIKEGKPTACSEACPAGATIFGDREDLLREARSRITSNPGGYIEHIYGEKEAGGTSILFLSPKPFKLLGFNPEISKEPYPMLTWVVMSKIPPFALVWGGVLAGLWWFTERKNKIATSHKEEK